MKRIAVELAKSVYQVTESVRSGQVVQRKRLNREAFRRYIQERSAPVEWVMEACGTAHFWGRTMQAQGHRVMLIHPRYVRPYRRRNKSDRNDCDAMLEAARCRDIHPVPVKTQEQQHVQLLHGLRETWKKARTQRINLLRGILREAGVETPARTREFLRAAHELIERPELAALRHQLQIVHLHEQCMAECEQQLQRWHADGEVVRALDEVSGIGVLTASALRLPSVSRSALPMAVSSAPDGGRHQATFLVVVVKSETVGTGESCSGTRPITMMLVVID